MAIDDAQVNKLLERARREVDEGLLPSVQVALAYQGEIVAEEAFGDATLDHQYCIFSATKPFVASAVWTLMADGTVDAAEKVTTYFPEFGEGDPTVVGAGKADITVEQVMLHTAGFPHAPMGPPVWNERASRVERMAQWRLNWEPGTRFEYHPTSAHWVLAEIIDRVTGSDYRDVVEQRITTPAGLPRILGIANDQQDGIADLHLVGEPATADELEATFGVRELPASEVNDELVQRFNDSATREVGVPGGGGYARARDLALFYQELLHNSHGIWDPDILANATGQVRNTLPDPMGVPANRSLGLILAGDDGMANMRGLGRTVSPQAFGHPGAGGQLAWADPVSGLSLGYVTNGYDRHQIREPRRGTSISSVAGTCVAA
ncbi:MAG: CubicO group peptidase (beta-lactamase class C family) [Acidimicrobiales bacterium]|jgi:CubicO group peptidase (beta-lactamase class C family)